MAILFGAYNFVFLNKIPPNSKFGLLNISGKTEEQIQNIVSNSISNYEQRKQKITAGSKTVEFTLEELGVYYDAEKTVNYLNRNAKISSLYNFKKVGTALLLNQNYEPIYSIDSKTLHKAINEKFSHLESFAINSNIIIEKGEPKIANSKNGVVIDIGFLMSQLKNNLSTLSSKTIVAQHTQQLPTIRTNQVQKAYDKVVLLNEQNLSLSYERDTWSFSGEQLLDLLAFELYGFNGENILRIGNSDNHIILKNIDYDNRDQPILQVALKKDSVDQIIEEMAVSIDKQTVDATLEFDGLKVSRFTAAQDGRLLDKNEVRSIILNLISVDNLAYETNVNINLPVIETKAKIANEEINSLGIKELIASGISYFRGSIANRAFNIGLGSEFINGTVVPPGEVFSFNEIVGPVSSEQGFKQAYVINKGRTVLDDGGGICQVSTTVFRAALNAGLPIVQRTAHAYRVSYYEQRGFEPGYDATIWSPTVDLKFRNDTGHHILVQAIVDRVNSKLQVDIYGTSDGRRVELTKPVLTNRRPAPEPLYEDDPTLPTGTTKQIDWAAEGLTSVFDRTVSRNGEIIIDESFRSNFRPWQAVYLVGTGG